MDKSEAIKATKNGAIAACVSGALTLAIFLIAVFTNASGTIGLWNDPSVIFDVLLIFACAYGIYKHSRFAAILLFFYFIFAKIYISIEMGKISGIWVTLVFLYFYGKAIQGTFVYNKIEKVENPNYKTTPKWIYFTAIPSLAIFFALMGIGILTMTGVLPSTKVQKGSEISQRDRSLLISNAIVSKSDNIKYFYSGGLTSILEGGSILTDDRVILYLPDANQELEVYAIYLDDIASVELIKMGNFMNDSIYKVSSYEPDVWLQITLSVENRGDVKFINALRYKVAKATYNNASQRTSR